MCDGHLDENLFASVKYAYIQMQLSIFCAAVFLHILGNYFSPSIIALKGYPKLKLKGYPKLNGYPKLKLKGYPKLKLKGYPKLKLKGYPKLKFSTILHMWMLVIVCEFFLV